MSGGGTDPRQVDLATTVVVPARPGPTVRLADLRPGRDDVDVLLDDVFGAPDEGGAGPLDAVLLLGGAAAIVAGLTTIVPSWVLVAGIAAFALGAILPVRSFWRRARAARRTARVRHVVGDGVLLRVDHPDVAALVAAHDRCTAAASTFEAWRRVRVDAVAHAALVEVATLLDGAPPGSPTEERYVRARSVALEELAAALGEPSAHDDGSRRARAEARLEVEQLAGGSAVEDAEALARDLRGTP